MPSKAYDASLVLPANIPGRGRLRRPPLARPGNQGCFLAGADVNQENGDGKTAVEIAIDESHFKIAHYLLGWRNRDLGQRRPRLVFPPPQAYYQEPPVQEPPPQPVVAPTPTPPVVATEPAPVVTAIVTPEPVPATAPPAVTQSPPETPTQMESAAVQAPEPTPVETAIVTPEPVPATAPPPATESGPGLFERVTEYFSSPPRTRTPRRK